MSYSTSSEVVIYASCNKCNQHDTFFGESHSKACDNAKEEGWYIVEKTCDSWCPKHVPLIEALE